MQLPDTERVLIFDFGAQYAQLIARRVREQNVFCQLVRHDLPVERVAELQPRGLIFSGGPASVYAPGAPHCDPKIFDLGIPVLGSHRKSPWPRMNLLDDPWPRAGHPPLKLMEVLNGS